MDFSNYKIHIPVEKTAGTLLEPEESTFPLKEEEIYSYNEGIKIILQEGRALWLPDDAWRGDMKIVKYFKKLGVKGFDF